MKDDIKISIIIPIYNVENYIHKCVDSVLMQTYKNIEVILVDDGSTDKCPEICDDYAAKDERVKVIHKINEGISNARNAALQIVSGKYMTLVDGDDWIEPNTCEVALKKALERNAEVVFWPYIREYENHSAPKKIFDREEIIYEEDDVKNKLYRRAFGIIDEELASPENADALCTAWGKLYRTAIIKENNLYFYDNRKIGSYEDGLFNLYVWSYVKRAVYINDYLYHYRRDNINSLTSIYKDDLFDKWQLLSSIMDNIIQENNLGNEYTAALQNRICLSIIGLGLNILGGDKNVKKLKKLTDIIGCEQYRQAYKQLSLKYFPIHWKIFFFFAKYNIAPGVYIMLKAINRMRGH